MSTQSAGNWWQPRARLSDCVTRLMRASYAAIRSLSRWSGIDVQLRSISTFVRAEAFEIDESWLTAAREQRLVEAMCTCLLGDLDGAQTAACMPHSLAELVCKAGASLETVTGRTASCPPRLLPRGLCILDRVALDEAGRHFEEVSRVDQLRLLGRLEGGRLALSRASGLAFIDRFLVLTAQAYLAAEFRSN